VNNRKAIHNAATVQYWTHLEIKERQPVVYIQASGMPPLVDLPPDDLMALLAYLDSFK
jgi:hypothetical protein